jgi:hypothetical protein
MEKRWMERGVDLASLTNYIGNFFKERDFEAIKGQTSSGYNIFAEDSPHFKLDGCISVTIEGKPNDFIVKLELCKKEKRHSLAPILLTTMFLGGYPLLKRLKSEENWIRFEKEFWSYLNNIVMSLTNSDISQAKI